MNNTVEDASDLVGRLAREKLDPSKTIGAEKLSRLTHVSVEYHFRDMFVVALHMQHAYNVARVPPIDTWAVVASSEDAELLKEDMQNGFVAGVKMNEEELFIEDGKKKPAMGAICIFTYAQFLKHKILPAKNAEGAEWLLSKEQERDLTIYMDWGCGDFTFTMAVSIMGATKVVTDHCRNHKAKIGVCAFSNTERSPWGNAGVQTIKLEPADGDWKNRRKIFLVGSCDDEQLEALVLSLDEDPGRIVLFADPGRISDLPVQVTDRIHQGKTKAARRDKDHHLVNPREVHLGPVDHVSSIVIDAGKQGWVYDTALTKVCASIGPRSRAELRLAEDIKPAQKEERLPQVHYAMSEEELDKLPETPISPMALTRDIEKTLLCCIVMFPLTLFHEMPLPLIPELELDEYLRRLERQRLIEMRLSSRQVLADHAQGGFKATEYGVVVAGFILEGEIGEFGAACLLGQLRQSGRPMGLTMSPAVLDAVLIMGAVLKLSDSPEAAPYISRIIKVHGETFPDTLVGVGKSQAIKGPMWQAVAIWHKVVTDLNWRQKEKKLFLLESETRDRWVRQMEGWTVNLYHSFLWDTEYDRLSKVWGAESSLNTRHDLTRDERLAVDVALVWAFLDRILIMQCRGEGEASGEQVYAVDLVSRRQVTSSAAYHTKQLDVEACRKVDQDARVDGKAPGSIYCIYSYLNGCRDENGSKFWRAYDVTFVQAAAVQKVFRELPKSPWMHSPLDVIKTGLRGKEN